MPKGFALLMLGLVRLCPLSYLSFIFLEGRCKSILLNAKRFGLFASSILIGTIFSGVLPILSKVVLLPGLFIGNIVNNDIEELASRVKSFNDQGVSVNPELFLFSNSHARHLLPILDR